MNIDQINTILNNKFKNNRIVFWYDTDGEFQDVLKDLDIGSAKIHIVDDKNTFYTKCLLEKNDTISKFLIYSASPQPSDLENWLLDTVLYSDKFTADKTGLIMNTVGIDNPDLKIVFDKYSSFFSSTQRTSSFKELIQTISKPSESELVLAMLSVLTKGKQLSFEHVIKNIVSAGLDETENKPFNEITKHNLAEAFWKIVETEFGYKSTTPSLKTMFLTIALTSFKTSVYCELPKDWQDFIVGNKNACTIFISNWFNHSKDSSRLEELLIDLDEEIDLKSRILEWEISDYENSEIFPSIDEAIILQIINNLSKTNAYNDYYSIIKNRENTHWYGSVEKYRYIYQALYYALKMFEFKHIHNDSIKTANAIKIWELYTSDYFKMDQYYRLFYTNYDLISSDILKKSTKQEVEDLYTNWYLEQLSSAWHQAIKEDLKDNWCINTLEQQKDFYHNYITPILTESDRDKVFVIISDALRFEIASQLSSELVHESVGTAKLKAMQGSLPSYTKLGMTALLPHKSIEFKDDARITIDGIITDGIENRKNILEKYENSSIAISSKELIGMSISERKQAFESKRVVYVYHNTIDSTGDSAKTEDKVFKASIDTIVEIKELVKAIINANGNRIFITSDHGFIYKRDPIAEDQKVKREDIEALVKNRRFFITKELNNIEGCISFPLDYIFENKLYVITPNGYLRFKTQGGGEKYVHGGSTLQEIVIPLVEYKHVRSDKNDDKYKPTPVDIDLTNVSKVITNNIVSLNFFQKDKVNGKHIKREVKIGFWDPQSNQLISDEKILVAESQDEQVEARQYKVTLRIKSGKYEKGKKYELRLKPLNDGVSYKVIPFEINITINADFDDF